MAVADRNGAWHTARLKHQKGLIEWAETAKSEAGMLRKLARSEMVLAVALKAKSYLFNVPSGAHSRKAADALFAAADTMSDWARAADILATGITNEIGFLKSREQEIMSLREKVTELQLKLQLKLQDTLKPKDSGVPHTNN